MEYWGIDRSCTSLRLKALNRLGRLENVSRMGSVLPPSGEPLCLNLREFEVLLATANNATDSALSEQLAQYLVSSLDMKVVSRVSHYETAPWYSLSKALAAAVSRLGNAGALIQFLERAESIWLSKPKNEQAIAFAFCLRGFYDGMADEPLDIKVAEVLFDWTAQHFTDEFQSGLHSALQAAESHLERPDLSPELETLKLCRDNALTYPGPTQISMSVAAFVRQVSRTTTRANSNTLTTLLKSNHFDPHGPEPPRVGAPELLERVAVYASEQIKSLENGYQFRIEQFPHLVPLSARSMWYYLEPLGLATFYELFDAEQLHQLIVPLMESDQVDSKDEALLNLVRVAMISLKGDEHSTVLLVRSLCSYLGAVSVDTAKQAGAIFVAGISNRSQTVLVTTIYTLINSLNIDEYMLRKRSDAESTAKYASSILNFVSSMVIEYNDAQIYELLVTVLSQKYNSVSQVFDVEVLASLAYLAPFTSSHNFAAILTLIKQIEHDATEKQKDGIIGAIERARCNISASLDPSHSEFDVYLEHLLTLMVEKGEAEDLSLASNQAVMLLAPLGALLPERGQPHKLTRQLVLKFRDAWLNLAVLGFSIQSKWTPAQERNLAIIARNSPPLVTESSTNQTESDLELNTVLRRGSTHHNIDTQRRILGGFFNREVRAMSFLRIMFNSATIFLEHHRVAGGVVCALPHYFGDPVFREGEGFREMDKITMNTVNAYIKRVTLRKGPVFDLPLVAQQFKELLVLCCHRVEAIRRSALKITNAFISNVPSALCHKTSAFALLDLLTLMWQGCVDAEEDAYEPTSTFASSRSGVEIHLGDSYELRRHALKDLLASARSWSKIVLGLMSEDFKSILTLYLDVEDASGFDNVALGRSFALELGGSIRESDLILTSRGAGFHQSNPDNLANGSSGFLSQYLSLAEYHSPKQESREVLSDAFSKLTAKQDPVPEDLSAATLRQLYVRGSQFVDHYDPFSLFVAKSAVHIPFRYFSGPTIKTAVSFWVWMFHATPELRMPIMQEVAAHWTRSIDRRIGLFSRKLDNEDPMYAEMQYVPTNKPEIDAHLKQVERQYEPHLHLINFLKSGFHASVCVKETDYIDLYVRIMLVSMRGLCASGSLHALSRTLRMELIKLGLDVLSQVHPHRPQKARELQQEIVKAALSWYKQSAKWSFGGNLIQQRKDLSLLRQLSTRIEGMLKPTADVAALQYFLQEELYRLEVWYEPLGKGSAGHFTVTPDLVSTVWSVDPELAVYLLDRNYEKSAYSTLVDLVGKQPLAVVNVAPALLLYLENAKDLNVLYWAQSSPIQSISLFDVKKYAPNSYLSQYAMRSLESHPITTCFFYVPQIVQLLRHDKDGYVEEYILEAAKFSQLFAHQIIWNILANAYRGDEGDEMDPMKPTLDRVVDRMKASFTKEEQDYYDREFSFFNDVTSISGKLKPYIKKSKAEKKAKIDEEMNKIKVPEGVYLPSHPHGTVVDIDRDSGRPLQSHAKAPFLARFRIEQDGKQSWQGAIFKVGDDCRQDVLALQLISVFRNIFNASGLDAYVFPNKVTATAPGCGIIDVLPNSISRDMLGREAVNGLYEWFITKHGGEDSIAFQRARNNFVKSMAAYSIITYLLQFKDRHNGNIMYDDDGHVIHIDFGFCFDICPGGVKFEAAPFKLTKEMVAVMGGSPNTQAYKWFEELCVKVFLTCRLYYAEICCVVEPMLESGLPCFKPETMKKLKARFVLNKTEREAAQYVRGLIHKSYESTFTTVYDEFQRITNGIPY